MTGLPKASAVHSGYLHRLPTELKLLLRENVSVIFRFDIRHKDLSFCSRWRTNHTACEVRPVGCSVFCFAARKCLNEPILPLSLEPR